MLRDKKSSKPVAMFLTSRELCRVLGRNARGEIANGFDSGVAATESREFRRLRPAGTLGTIADGCGGSEIRCFFAFVEQRKSCEPAMVMR